MFHCLLNMIETKFHNDCPFFIKYLINTLNETINFMLINENCSFYATGDLDKLMLRPRSSNDWTQKSNKNSTLFVCAYREATYRVSLYSVKP